MQMQMQMQAAYPFFHAYSTTSELYLCDTISDPPGREGEKPKKKGYKVLLTREEELIAR